jgi:hypothetical protein
LAIRVEACDVMALSAELTAVGAAAIQPFLDDASAWVDSNLVSACTSLSTSDLAAIEKYLAAHLVTLGKLGPELVASKREGVSEQYAQGPAGTTTRFIQSAAAFDRCGIVRKHWLGGKIAKATFGVGYRGEPHYQAESDS